MTRDAAGGRTETWATAFKAWGEQLRAREVEKVLGESDRAEDERHFRIRWRDDIDPRTHRVAYADAKFDITGMTEEGLKDHLILTCRNVESLTT